MALRKAAATFMPSFNLGSKPAATKESRPILRNIANSQADTKAFKPKLDLKPVAVTVGPSIASLKPKVEADVRPMDVDVPRMQWPELPAGVENIDDEEADNPLLVAEYVNDIYAYMRDLEVRHATPENYLASSQRETCISEKMRAILVDWLAEVHMRFKLLQETLFMTVDLVDRFLAVHPVQRNKLQLVGVTAMLIASKYEEMYPPEVRDFVYIADNAYSKAEIFQMEALMLRKLDFNLGTPLPLHFLRRFSRACHADTQVHTLAKYFMEVKMMSYNMIRFKPSETAAASIWIARKVCDASATWTPTLVHYSGYSEAAIEPCIAALQAELARSVESAHQAVRRKYASPKLYKASEMPELAAYIKSLQW
eukprot:m.96820 g.96820  ORF g.96820 m.96820 type:complete len:368 (-) comp8646_c0_seq2:138-1241(-)